MAGLGSHSRSLFHGPRLVGKSAYCHPTCHPLSPPSTTYTHRVASPPSLLLSQVNRLPCSSNASSCGLRRPVWTSSKSDPSGLHRNTDPVSGVLASTLPVFGSVTCAPRSATEK